MPNILFKFPSRERPIKFFNAIDNIISMIGQGIDYSIQATLDLDDSSMFNEEIKNKINSYGGKVKAYWGISTSKINAINRDMEFAPEFDILLLHSDDFIFTKQDFGKDIIEAFNNYNGLVHFPDQVQGHKLCTYPMMSKDYFYFFRYIYNPNYNSVYSDREQQDVAKRIGKYKFVNTQLFEHRHHRWGWNTATGERINSGEFVKPDDLAKKQDSREMYELDGQTYKDFKNIAIVTSLSCNHANGNNQNAAIKSWNRIGECFSVNIIDEVQKLKPLYDNIEFIETDKTIEYFVGRPLVSINVMIDVAKQKNKDLLLTNSDIIISELPELKQDGITVFSRYDYVDNQHDNKLFQNGFDVFFIPNKFLNVFPPSIYGMGAAYWDFWIPLHCMNHDIPVYYPNGKFCFHQVHHIQYNLKEWYHIGEYFKWEFKFPKQLPVEQIVTNSLIIIKQNFKK